VEVFPLECSVRPVGIRGDVDNICKAVLDGLNGVAWDDDRQVEMMEVHFVGVPRKGTQYVETEASDEQLQGPDMGGTS
jgi:Holliday junction resolvase RusA-like endonuclease